MPETNIARIPPNDMEAEQAVLSSMLFEREAIAAAYEVVGASDFYSPANQFLYETMVELFSQGIAVDVITLNDKLAEKGLLEQIGGRDTVIRLASAYYTSVNIRQHAQIVAEKSILRQLIKASGQILASGYDARDNLSTLLENAEKSIFDISLRNANRDFTPMGHVMIETLARLEDLYQTQGAVTGVATGFVDIDRKLAGLQPSDLILIGSRPSMGKTAFLLSIAQNASVRNAIPTAFFSLEMSSAQLGNRLLSAEAMVDSQRLRTGRLEGDDWDKVTEAIPHLSTAPLYIDDTPGISITEMRAKCRRLKIEKQLGLVMVDYLQLMSSTAGSRPESRQLEISEISRSLKAMAKELNVPVVVAAQLSRAVEARKDHRPMLSDLRESGAIEQDADVVAFLYRDEYYNPETLKKNHAEIIIAKQRNGPTGTVELAYLGAYTKFTNMQKGPL
ncbi:MAG: replicative DNA helicase [Defluviitaleaceae bacterium]|nr:replicative DNA helicase [Defluviitaleaceae bacterium]MCL2240195.1 replicative DNA helicase [Defluviitaleaceae bacterium]